MSAGPVYARGPRGVFAAALTLVSSFMLVACGSGASSGSSDKATGGSKGVSDKTIAFSHPASQVPFVVSLQKQVVAAGQAKGVKVLTDNAQSKLSNQVASVQSWVTQGVSAINLLPIDPGAFSPLQAQAQGKGICWQTYTVPVTGADGLVGWSPTKSGELIGAAAVEWIKANKPDAKVLVLTASAFVPFAARTDVPTRMIKEQTGATIVGEQDALDQASGLTVTETVLKKHPDLDVVIGFNDDGALGAARAFANAKKDAAATFIAGQDGSEEGLRALLDNPYYKGSVAIPLIPMANAIVDGMLECIAGNRAVSEQVPLVLVTPHDEDKIRELEKAF